MFHALVYVVHVLQEEESGSSENQAAAGASVANNVAIPKITFTGPDNNQVTKT